MRPILHPTLPIKPWMTPRAERLPGLSPCQPSAWIIQDDCYAEQMAYRDWLIANKAETILYRNAKLDVMGAYVLEIVLDECRKKPDFDVTSTTVLRPDGVTVVIAQNSPWSTLVRLIQEDMLILIPGKTGFILSGGVLCFPAGWMLSEKVGRPLFDIHDPVVNYSESLDVRIQRILTNMQMATAFIRHNFLLYSNAELHHPRSITNPKRIDPDMPLYVRVERQVLRKLSKDGAIAFTIHTYLLPVTQLTDEEKTCLLRLRMPKN